MARAAHALSVQQRSRQGHIRGLVYHAAAAPASVRSLPVPSTARAHRAGRQVAKGGAMQVSEHSNGQAAAGVSSFADAPTETFGSWIYRLEDAALSWDDEVFELFGFAVNEVVPTLLLMSSHQHPQDRPTWDEQLRKIFADGRPVSAWHRIIDAHTHHRTVHTVLSAVADNHARSPRSAGR